MDSIDHEVSKPVERQVEARSSEDATGSIVRSLYFADTFLTSGNSTALALVKYKKTMIIFYYCYFVFSVFCTTFIVFSIFFKLVIIFVLSFFLETFVAEKSVDIWIYFYWF